MTISYWSKDWKLVYFDNVQVVSCGGYPGIYGVFRDQSGIDKLSEKSTGAWLYPDGYQMENEHHKTDAIMNDNDRFNFAQIMPWNMIF